MTFKILIVEAKSNWDAMTSEEKGSLRFCDVVFFTANGELDSAADDLDAALEAMIAGDTLTAESDDGHTSDVDWLVENKEDKSTIKNLFILGAKSFGSKIGGFDKEWDGVAELILDLAIANAVGFQSDVALKAKKFGSISEKQQWVIAFWVAEKLTTEMIDTYADAAVAA